MLRGVRTIEALVGSTTTSIANIASSIRTTHCFSWESVLVVDEIRGYIENRRSAVDSIDGLSSNIDWFVWRERRFQVDDRRSAQEDAKVRLED